jgi:hypothetical protein
VGPERVGFLDRRVPLLAYEVDDRFAEAEHAHRRQDMRGD